MDSTIYGKLSALEVKSRDLSDRLFAAEKKIAALEKEIANQKPAPAEVSGLSMEQMRIEMAEGISKAFGDIHLRAEPIIRAPKKKRTRALSRPVPRAKKLKSKSKSKRVW